MRKILAFAALAVMSIASISEAKADLVLDVAVGYNASLERGGFEGPHDTARFTLTWMPKEDGFFVSYTHLSHFSVGWPIDNKDEDYVDLLEVGYRFNFNKLF